MKTEDETPHWQEATEAEVAMAFLAGTAFLSVEKVLEHRLKSRRPLGLVYKRDDGIWRIFK